MMDNCLPTRTYNGGRSYPFPVWNGIFEHRKKIGPALWVYLWCLDRITSEESGAGLVLGGSNIAAERIAGDLEGSDRTVRRHLERLAKHGYIGLQRTPYGFIITVRNSRKFNIWRADKNDHPERTKMPVRADKDAAQMATFVRCNKEDTAVDSAQRQLVPPNPPLGGLTSRDRRIFFAQLKQIYAASIGVNLDEEDAIRRACVNTGTPFEAAREWVALSYGGKPDDRFYPGRGMFVKAKEVAHNPGIVTSACGIVPSEANRLAPLRGDFSAMTRRRFQDPKPFREGNWWWISPWQDGFKEGRFERKRKRMKVCPADVPEREVRKLASEMLRPMNQGLQTIGSAISFAEYVTGIYRPTVLPLMATTTQASYLGTLRKYIMPTFGEMPLRDLSTLTLQKYFSGLGTSDLGGETVLKIKEVLSAVLGSAVRYDLLTKNPVLAVQIPRTKVVNRKKQKPHITPEEFGRLVEFVDEPYATMIYVAVFSGLRVSELVGLKWEDVHHDSLTVDERYCRGDWSITKTPGSATTIGVDASVIAQIFRLKTSEVEINWGGHGARKRIRLVRSDGPKDLVFQSLRGGAPMREGNVLRRHLRPAAIKMGIDPKKATWRSLRTSCATWMIEAGANPKDVQGQMRHSRISTTMDIYAQHVPESQRRALAKMMDMVESRRTQIEQSKSASIN